ncbi:hypothetical protein Bca101_013942 [Brassica carinata]
MGRAPCCEKIGLKRGRWTAEEDEILSNYIQSNGEGSWRSLPKKAGRTDNEIKNYWNSHLSRKIYAFTAVTGDEHSLKVDDLVLNKFPSSFGAKNTNKTKKKKGRTSRSSMKKHKQMVTDSQCLPQPKELESEISEGGNTGNYEGKSLGAYEWLDGEIERLMSSFVWECTSEEAVIRLNDDDSDQMKVCESGDNSSCCVDLFEEEQGKLGSLHVDQDMNIEKEREGSILSSNSNENGDKDWWVGLCDSSDVGFGIDDELLGWEFQGGLTCQSDDLWDLSDFGEIQQVDSTRDCV